MRQTPAHDHANLDLLAVMPAAARVAGAGCSRGALARAYKQRVQDCHYTGIEIDADYAEQASFFCDNILVGDIEAIIQGSTLDELAGASCWGDTLEHLRAPWQVLRSLHRLLSDDGRACACIPNMQHWSIQLQLNSGLIRYVIRARRA